MCLSPITIVNPSKYVSLKYRDQYLLQVPCGKCAECQSNISNQWLYRTYYEFQDCLSTAGNFCIFDTLTYSDKYLPHMSDFMPVDKDFPCFNGKHIQDFMKRLRIALKRGGYDVKFRYFVSSEYGTSSFHSHRPHYHILLFVYGKVDPDVVSKYIAKSWYYGRTDGIPYKSRAYVYSHNVIMENSLSGILRTSNYVTKYVQKSCVFQKEIDRRVNQSMLSISRRIMPDDPDKWLESENARRVKISLRRLCNQFHRQSLHFGESALSDIDLNDLFDTGVLIMPHFKSIKLPVLLPTYYKRKLFYRLVEIDGAKSWQLNDLGLEYKAARDKRLLFDLEKRFQSVCLQHHLEYDCKRLANYVYFYRGRLRADLPPCSIEEKLQNIDLFNYVTCADKDALGSRGLSVKYLGNSSNGYVNSKSHSVIPMSISVRDFIAQYVILEDEREKELATIYYYVALIDKGKQSSYELKQRLTNLYKCFV